MFGGQDELLCGSTHAAGRRHGVSGPRCGGRAEEAGGGQLGLPAQPGGPDRQHRRGPTSDGRTGGGHPGEAGEERCGWTWSLPDLLDLDMCFNIYCVVNELNVCRLDRLRIKSLPFLFSGNE